MDDIVIGMLFIIIACLLIICDLLVAWIYQVHGEVNKLSARLDILERKAQILQEAKNENSSD